MYFVTQAIAEERKLGKFEHVLKKCEDNFKQLQDTGSSAKSKDEEINKRIQYELLIYIIYMYIYYYICIFTIIYIYLLLYIYIYLLVSYDYFIHLKYFCNF